MKISDKELREIAANPNDDGAPVCAELHPPPRGEAAAAGAGSGHVGAQGRLPVRGVRRPQAEARCEVSFYDYERDALIRELEHVVTRNMTMLAIMQAGNRAKPKRKAKRSKKAKAKKKRGVK